MNPIRILKNLFVDFPIWSSGSYVGSGKAEERVEKNASDNGNNSA